MSELGIPELAVLGLLALVPVLALALRAERDVVSLLTVFAVALMLIPAQWIVGPIGAAGTPAALVGVLAVWWWLAARLSPQWGMDLGPQPIRFAILGHGWFMVLTYALMYLRPLTELEVRGANRELIALVALSGIALLAADGVASRARLDVLLRRLVLLATVVAAIAAVQFFTAFDPVRLIQIPGLRLNQQVIGISARSIFNRPYSTTLHPIELSVVMAIVLPLALHFAFHARTNAQRALWWTCTGLIAAAIPMSVSRSGVVGVVLGMAVVALGWSWRRRLNVLVGTIGFTLVMWAGVPGLIGTLRGLFTNLENDPSITARTERVPRMLEVLIEKPWFGRGYGTFSVDDYFLLDNQYYVSAIEVGIVGVVVILALLFTGIATAFAVRRLTSDPEDRHLAIALAAGLVTVTVSIATFDAFFYRMFTGLMFLYLGCIGALWRLTLDARDTPADVPADARV